MRRSTIEDPAVTPRTLLIVDDEAALRELMAEDVQSLGFRVMEAATITQAKACIEGGGIDVVLTDLRLVGESGLELLKWLSGRDAGRMRAIVSSGGVDRDTTKTILAHGAIAILEKPHTIEELHAAIKLALQP